MTNDDKASEREEQHRESALARRKPSGPAPTGECHNCGESLAGDLRFCDADCRDDFERRQKRIPKAEV